MSKKRLNKPKNVDGAPRFPYGGTNRIRFKGYNLSRMAPPSKNVLTVLQRYKKLPVCAVCHQKLRKVKPPTKVCTENAPKLRKVSQPTKVCAEMSPILRKVNRETQVCAENTPKLRKVVRATQVCAKNATILHKVSKNC